MSPIPHSIRDVKPKSQLTNIDTEAGKEAI